MKLRDRLLSGMLGAFLIFGSVGMSVSAANVTEIPATEGAVQYMGRLGTGTKHI